MALAIARGNGLSWSADDDGHCSAFERVMVHSASQMTLPAPRHDAEVSLEHALQYRRSIREFARGALTLAEVGQLLTPAAG
jgi:ferric-dicitrate binding protein FerR (iron transport regulator)